MPSENRRVIFTQDEFKMAAFDYCLRMGRKMPKALVTGIVVERAGELCARMHFEPTEDGEERSVLLQYDEIAKALIRYCRSARIPIPRNAKKRLLADGEGICMTFDLIYDIILD